MASSSSLSNVVSTLVRAQMGSSVPSSITDEDLDRHIGEIILREAKAKAERYKKEGIRAYLPRTDPNAPKTNKRFLSSIIKNTDEHNKGIQKIQDQVRQEREEQDRRERMKRAKEAAAVRQADKSQSGRRNYHYNRDGALEDRWRPEDDDERDRERKRRKRDWEKDFEEVKEKRRRERSRSVERKRYWDEDEEEYEERMRKHKRSKGKEKSSKGKQRRVNTPSPVPSEFRSYTPPKSSPRSHSPSPSPMRRNSGKSRRHVNRHDEEQVVCKRGQIDRLHELSPSPSPSSSKSHIHKRREYTPSPSPTFNNQHVDTLEPASPPSTGPVSSTDTRRRSTDRRKGTSGPRSPSIEPPSLPPLPPPPSSKMDKYFKPDYDPRLDVTPLTNQGRLTVNVPATGLIDDPSWDSWEAMLELIKLKREDKIEKKRLEKLGLLPDEKNSVGGSGKKGKGMVSASVTGEDRGLMDITYTKRGTVREWDMGKEIV